MTKDLSRHWMVLLCDTDTEMKSLERTKLVLVKCFWGEKSDQEFGRRLAFQNMPKKRTRDAAQNLQSNKDSGSK